MHLEYTDPKLDAIFRLTDNLTFVATQQAIEDGLIDILWNRGNKEVTFYIDSVPLTLRPGQITTSTYLQKVRFSSEKESLTVFSFNREFYCIQDHDSEVSCNGIIFFGTQETPVITLDNEESLKMDLLYQVFLEEFATKDNIQGEMLRMLLKRLIIKCTRFAKQQLITNKLDNHQIDIVRQFNVLVDIHYRTKKHVHDYADLLNKSPKTLSNHFSLYNQKTPLQIIHERIVLEARRLLIYTDMTSKEVAFELGFDDVSAFNKMFKKIISCTPLDFKKSIKKEHSGRITYP